jgi:Sec-independent protein translocase protein TatA
MMGISGMELMVIALVTLILFGPKELPETIRTAARALGLSASHGAEVPEGS